MKRLFVVLTVLLSSVFTGLASETAGSDGHIYRGRYANYSDIIYTWDGEHLY